MSVTVHPEESSVDHAQRAGWLRLLALAPGPALARVAGPVLADFRFEWLRRPERGLVMVRARIGNSGDRFNLGEATITRCAVRHRPQTGVVVAGVGHVLGLDEARAERVAQVDALLQVPSLHVLLDDCVLGPLRDELGQRQRAEKATTESTRVRFFTLQAEAS